MKVSSNRRCRAQLLAGCALALWTAPAFAQSYPDRALQGDSTVVSGSVTVGRTPLRDTVTVASAQAIINWNPETGPLPLPASPAPINFLPNGREAVFQGATIGQDFVVLNRILPSTNRPISINGTVTSQVITGFAPGPPLLPTYGRGGSVWFYSPGGIIAGPTSVFNVGNLILTANDIDATGGLFSGAGAIRFRSASGSVAAVTVQPGAQINLTNAGSYFGIVAPQVTMGGTATVNGSTAYVAAEQVDMTLNGGFFSISFLVGTDVGSALTHTGTTTGPAGNGTIAMAAMPKNTAITMLVGGTVGYTPAATATVQNGTIVLSAGQDLVFGNIGQNASTTAANLNIGSGLFRSEVNAQATNIVATPTGGAPLTFTGNANLTGLTSASVQVDAGQSMTVGGAFNLVSKRGGTGGTAGITVNGGTLSVAGSTLIDTSAFGIDNFAGPGGNATGGQSRLTVNGGTVTLGDTLSVRADGIGGGGTTISGNGTGGTASVTLNAGATPTVLTLNGFSDQISATGSVNGQFPSISGGNATGGSVLLTVNSGTMNSVELNLDASANGGDATTGLAGTASGGTARVLLTGGRYDTESLFLASRERQAGAGVGGTAGSTTGTGLAAVDVDGAGVLSVGASGGNGMSIDADAVKAGPRSGTPASGGAVIAGTARLTATNGGTITTDATAPSGPKQPVLVTASVVFLDTVLGAPTSSQRAGTVLVNADGGTMTLHRLDMRANALARDFVIPDDRAGPSFGGTATLAARNGGSIAVRTGEGVTPISAYGTGGSTNTPALGTGGTVDVLALGGTLALPDGLSVDTRGFSGTTLGGTGGTINLRSTAGAAARAGSLTAGVTTLNASGQISAGLPNATAGAITVANIGAGQTMTFANLLARAGAANGAASGSITLTADNAPILTTALTTGIDLGTLGTLTINAVGAAGTITGSTGVFGYGNDILVSHTGVAPGSTSTITGPAISLEAGRDQIHTGSVTMRGGAVTLVGRRTLGGVDSAVFSTGDINLGSGLNASTNGIVFRILDATGRLRGFQGASSYTNEITTPSSFVVGERVYAGIGDIDIRAGTGVDIADAGTSATGQVALSSTAADVRLATSGVILATRPNGISMSAPGGTARFTNLFSRASITIAGLSGVAGGDASAAFGISATSASSGVTVGNVQATSTTLTAATNVVAGTVFGLTGATLTATTGSITATAVSASSGAVSAAGSTGVDIATVTASGAVALAAPNGAVRVATNLAATGAITATGRSIFLRSLGALNINALSATAGDLDVSSVGALSVTTPQATGAVSLASTGSNLAFGSATAGTTLSLTVAGTVTGTSGVAGGAVSVIGATGITIPTLLSGGATTLNAVNGAISVATNLQSAGLVTASGRSLLLSSTGGLNAAALTATAGNVDVSAGAAFAVSSAQASVDAILSSGAVLTPGAVTAGRDIVLTGQSVEAGSLAAPRDVRIVTMGLARATGTIAATRDLVINAGQTNFQAVSGGSVAITSGQGVIFGALTSASTATLNAGDDAVGTSVAAAGNVAVNAGRNINFGTLQTGGNATLYGNTTTGFLTVGSATIGGFLEARGAALAFGNVSAGTDVLLSSFNGALSVGNVTAGDDIFLTVNGSFANAATASPDSQTGVVSNTVNTLVAGNLRSTGLGSDAAASGPRTFAGAGPTGNVIRVRASGAVQTGSITTAGTAIIASDLSTIATQAVNAATGVSVFVRGNVTMGDIVTTGNFSIGDSSQIFSFVPFYQPFTFGFSQTSTSGGATLGTVTAANIGGTTRDGLVYNSLAATGFTSWTSSLGSIAGGSLAAGTPLNLTAGGSIGFTTASAGTTALLIASNGSITGTSITAPTYIDLSSATGVFVPTVTSAGTVNLSGGTGPVSVNQNIIAGGGLIASGASIFLRGTAAIDATLLVASAGGIDVVAAGNLTVTNSQSTGATAFTSTAGNIAGTTVVSGAVTSLLAPTGAINVTDLNSAGLVIANGRAVTIGSTGALAFQALGATAGSAIVTTTGALSVPAVTATEDIRLSSGAAPAVMTTGNLTAGDDIVLQGSTVTTGNLTTTGLGPDAEGTGGTIDLQLNQITTGVVVSAGSILLAASQPITFASTTSRFGTIIRSFGPIAGGNSTAGTTLDIQGGSINTANGQAGLALNYVNFNPADSIRTGTLTGATVTASSRGTLATGAVNAVGAVNLFGDLGATVALATSTNNAIQLLAQTSGPIVSGALRAAGDVNVLTQTGSVTLTTLDAGGLILLRAGGGALSFTRATAAGLVGMSATGNIGFGTVQAGGTFQAQTPGTITGTSVTSASGSPNIIQGGAGVTLPTLITNGVTALSAADGAVNIATDLRSTGGVTADGQSIFIRSSGPLLATRLTATGGNINVASSGALTVTTGRASGNVVLSSNSDVVVDAIESGFNFDQEVLTSAQADVTLTGNNIILGASVIATRAIDVRALGTVNFNGLARGTTIDVRSTDVAIAPTARVGILGTTTQVNFTNTATSGTTFVGGSGTSAEYRLSDTELQRVFANNIAVSVVPIFIGSGGQNPRSLTPTLAPDLVLDTLTLAGGVNLGASGIFRVQTPGKIRVVGTVTLNGMTVTNRVDLIAGTSIEALPTSSIILRGAAGLAGTLGLTSEDVIASSSAALANVAAAATLGAASDRLGANDGAAVDGGYFQAGGIVATVSRGIYVQNSGTAAANANRDYSGRRGFTVGSGGFTIVQASSAPLRIAINGRQVGDTTSFGAPTIGGFVTGLDVIPLIRIRSIDSQSSDVFQVPPSGVLTSAQLTLAPRLFDTTSTVNGCAITGGSGCRVVPNDPIRDILLGDFGEGSVANLLPLSLVQLREYVTPGDEPLIDEPVTGAGNDDLWSVDDTKAKCDPEKEKCPA